jgi:hypothetical protein
MQTSTLRPGLLVSMKTSIRGNVSYIKRDLELEHTTKEGHAKARWETERTTADPQEHEEAVKARTRARQCIVSICSSSAFGLLCPEERGSDLDSAIAAGRQIVDEYNATARLTRLSFNVIAGRIAPDDIEAVRAINSEVRDLLEEMQTGISNMDAKAIRDAANRTRSLGQMLTPDAQVRIQMAIDAARAAAKKIKQAGEQAAVEIDRKAIRKITEMRTAFLDLQPAADVAAPAAQARSIDLVIEEAAQLDEGLGRLLKPTVPPIEME